MINIVEDDKKVLSVLSKHGATRTKKLKYLHIPVYYQIHVDFLFWGWEEKNFKGNIYIRKDGAVWYLTLDNEGLVPTAEMIAKEIDENVRHVTVIIQLRTESACNIDEFSYP